MKRKRLLARAACLAVLLALSGCGPSTGGPLDPVETSDHENGPDRTIVVRSGDLSAVVAARWSAQGSQSIRISYRNGGDAARIIRLDAMKMVHASGESALWTAVDATGIDLADDRDDNDRPRILFSREPDGQSPGVLEVPAGSTRDLDAEFTAFSNNSSVAVGDRVVVSIPMGDRVIEQTFTTSRPGTGSI